MDKELGIFEQLGQFFHKNPQYFGIFLVISGVFMLLAAIKNWEWFFRSHSFNIKKIQGISNMWGRGVARLVMGMGGISCIIFGIVWFVLYAFH